MKDPLVWCPNDFDRNGILFCDDNGDYRFNKETLRFVEANFQGYLIADSPLMSTNKEGNGTNTSISIGSCTPL